MARSTGGPTHARKRKRILRKASGMRGMSGHNYRLEPNVTITPDGKWVVFRSNMHGPTHVYAVELEAAPPEEPSPAPPPSSKPSPY